MEEKLTVNMEEKLTVNRDLPILVNELKSIASKWKAFGLQLPGMTQSELDSVKQPSDKDTLREMLASWLRNESNPTRKAIVNALSSVGESRLADELYTTNKRQKLNTQDMDVPCTNKCGWKGPQTALQEHLTAECPKQLVACEYKDDLGCCRELVPRDQLEKDMQENKQKHLNLAMKIIKGSKLSDCQVKQVEDTVKQQLEKCLSQELVSSLQKAMKEVEEKVDIKLNEADSKLTELESKLQEVETKQSKQQSDINSAVTKQITGIFIAPCTFSVSTTFREEWKSPPFYSHLGGCKMHIKLWPTNPKDRHTTFTVTCDFDPTYFYNVLSVTVEAMKFDPTTKKGLVPITDYKDTVEVPAGGTDDNGSKGELPNLTDYNTMHAECRGIRISVAGVDELVIDTRN